MGTAKSVNVPWGVVVGLVLGVWGACVVWVGLL